MKYHLGVDVGGTFTDLLLVAEKTGTTFKCKVPSTPADPSIGVLNGVTKICGQAGIDAGDISYVMHGTTVATNAILTGTGARVGLLTTRGYHDVLQIARSYVPGGLGGWVIYNKSEPLAPLDLTCELNERVGADGAVVTPLSDADVHEQLAVLKARGVEALTVSLINSYVNPTHERRVGEIAREVMPGVPVSLSCDVVPEMQEYERTITTVSNAFVRPQVAKYIDSLYDKLRSATHDRVKLYILRSDGGLATTAACADLPVNHLMSGPAGGVAGAAWIGRRAGYENLLTFDMGGTSTDVCLIHNGSAQLRRETTVGDLSIRAPSLDVRTVGAGGGSLAHVPELTKALRVGPQSAGADPGPACYDKGGSVATVTDANLVLGVLPRGSRLGGEMPLRRDLAEKAVQPIAKALGLSVPEAAAGIVKLANEKMFGALRLISVEKGYDPREFALMAFGGAGPMHANALGRLMGSWPVIVPPSPGVLCAYGDVTTVLRDEASQSVGRYFSQTSSQEIFQLLANLAEQAALHLDEEGVPRTEQVTLCEVDLRYRGQVLVLTVETDLPSVQANGLEGLGAKFDAVHKQLYTFSLDEEKEIVNVRSVVHGQALAVRAAELGAGDADPAFAKVDEQQLYVDGKTCVASVYDRERLKAGNRVPGPAIITEMDSTTLILPGHTAEVDRYGNILIWPDDRLENGHSRG